MIFIKDPCTHARTQSVNVRTLVSSRQNARAHVYTSCARLRARIFTKNHLIILNYLMNISLKFHKDRSFRCRDICKTILTYLQNVRARVSSRQNARGHVYASCARVCARIFTKNFLIILYYLINESIKFHKDRSFRCGDICKTILTFV